MNYNIDWTMLITKKMKEDKIVADKRLIDSANEDKWQKEEILFIADQLLAIEDDDPKALPGTERQWRDYRIEVRAWKDGGNLNFPSSEFRPNRPK